MKPLLANLWRSRIRIVYSVIAFVPVAVIYAISANADGAAKADLFQVAHAVLGIQSLLVILAFAVTL